MITDIEVQRPNSKVPIRWYIENAILKATPPMYRFFRVHESWEHPAKLVTVFRTEFERLMIGDQYILFEEALWIK